MSVSVAYGLPFGTTVGFRPLSSHCWASASEHRADFLWISSTFGGLRATSGPSCRRAPELTRAIPAAVAAMATAISVSGATRRRWSTRAAVAQNAAPEGWVPPSSRRPLQGGGPQSQQALQTESAPTPPPASPTSVELPCFSMCDPYASLLLHGVKTVETRNHPMLQGVTGFCLLHVGHKIMDENAAAEFLWRTGLADESNLDRITHPPVGLSARGQVLGVMELEETRQYTDAERRLESSQKKVASETVGKFATPVRRTWWLQQPLRERGQPGVWRASLPLELAPPDLRAILEQKAGAAQALVSQAKPEGGAEKRGNPEPQNDRADNCADLPKLVVFDLDGVCWSPEMYQTKGGPPYRQLAGGDVAMNSAGEEIRLFGAVRRIWALLHSQEARAHGIRVAVASSSRRNKAVPLLATLEVCPRVRMSDVIDQELFEMYYCKGEGKRPHLQSLLSKTKLPPSEVLFVDDNIDNIRSVAGLGVVAVHLPQGLSEATWAAALTSYRSKRPARP
ncbi:unnamed protein product [Polarella glacialis]|uniref:Magnesium-dependent phosphatase 1 n=1 Tax=Polarella glacialis TaxID=89957 RepID=A0A813L8Z1_POLGL|nr:unnamed protein product [Polarella glacialis]